MAILNYTTKIDPTKTIGEIQAILVKQGAVNVSVDYQDKLPVALTFAVSFQSGFLNFRLPSNHTGVYKALCKDKNIARGYKTEEQARRIAWRIVKDWVEAQLALIQAELATLAEVFLPYALTDSGQTVYDVVSKNGLKALSGSS